MSSYAMDFFPASDIQTAVSDLIEQLRFIHIQSRQVFCFRSRGSTSRAIARIWSLPRIWQMALVVSPAYVIEVISERFDKLSHPEQQKVLIHELLHIPKTFSGSLVPHSCFGKRIDWKTVERFFQAYQNTKSKA